MLSYVFDLYIQSFYIPSFWFFFKFLTCKYVNTYIPNILGNWRLEFGCKYCKYVKNIFNPFISIIFDFFFKLLTCKYVNTYIPNILGNWRLEYGCKYCKYVNPNLLSLYLWLINSIRLYLYFLIFFSNYWLVNT
jgi:hypothetical protein